MILLTSILCFFFMFFLAVSTNNILRAQSREARARIEDRLRAGGLTITSIQLEKRERLSDLPLLDRVLKRFKRARQFQAFLAQAGLSLSLGGYLLICALLGVGVLLAGFLFKIHALAVFPLSAAAAGLPYFAVSFRRAARVKKFSDRFPDAIGLMSSSLRVGHSLQMAVESVVREGKSSDIVAQEFENVLSEVEVGQSFETALKRILNRMDTSDLRLFISAVVLQRETGGNLAELLDNLENVIRERQEQARELNAATAQARLSGIILSLMPVFVALLLFFIRPAQVMFFFHDPAGIRLFALCVAGQTLGIVTIQKIVHIEM